MNTAKRFFDELRTESIGGVAYKNQDLKKKILFYFIKSGNATIADLSKELNLSNPKTGDLLAELIKDGLVHDYGKIDSGVGRKPNLYGLEPNSIFFVGVEVKKHHVNIGMLNFKKDLIKVSEKIPYELNNTTDSLDELCNIIHHFIQELPAFKDHIVGIGVNLTGRINHRTGYSYSFFHFSEDPLSKIIEEKLKIPTYLENDSRAMAYGEFCHGIVNNEKDVLFINVDYGVGLGIMINGQLYYGKSGFAGEFGHIPLFNNEIICHCGKRGCLETEASGQALVQSLIARIREGASSVVSKKHRDLSHIGLEDIIEAAQKEDTLVLELIAETGEKLGKGIATLINLYNPELVILGGSLSSTGDYLRLPVKSAINKYSLSLVNNDTELKMSKLGEQAGIFGACLLVRDRLLKLI